MPSNVGIGLGHGARSVAGPADPLGDGMLPSVQNYWRMESLLATLGSQNLVSNGSPAISFPSGKWGNAASIVAANSNYLSLSSSHGGIAVGPFAISLWFNATNAGSLVNRFSFGSGYFITLNNGSGGTIQTQFSSSGTSNLSVVVGASLYGQWNHIVYQRTDTNFEVYVNTVRTQGALSTNGSASGASLTFGGFSGSYHTVSLDDVIYFTRALTSDEIGRLYDAPLIEA